MIRYTRDGSKPMAKVKLERHDHLYRTCRSIVDNPCNIDDSTKAAFKAAALKYAHTQYDDPMRVLKRLYDDEGELGRLFHKAITIVVGDPHNYRSVSTGAVYPLGDVIDDDLDEGDGADDREPDDDGETDIEKAARDRGGPHSFAAAILDHMHDRLTRERQRHGYDVAKRKEGPTMDRIEGLTNAMKGGGLETFCKALIDNDSDGVSEYELVQAATKFAADANPGIRPDVAFAKLYESDVTLRKAVAKAAGAGFDVTIVSPGDATRQTVNETEQSEAYAQLEALAEKLHAAATGGKMTKAQAFARAFESNPELAAKAHQRPVAPAGGAYPFPR
jgi:hypothetical protein